MRSTLRRVLWLLPTLLVLSAVAFWLSSVALGGDASLAALPRFVNPNPRDCRSQALDALNQLSRADSPAAAATLVRLGGAALPHVLPELDRLPRDGQARLAQALTPIARRMALAGADEIDSPGAAVTFWRRFWQDRSTDFQPVVVKRLVRRLSEHNLELRRDDVVELDTFALQELVAALPRVRTSADVVSVARITGVAAQIVGNDWTIDEHASSAEAERLVERWRRWWSEHHSDYATFDGPRRVVAMVTETQYGAWAVRALRERLGATTDGRAVARVLAERAPVTVWLLGVGMVAGYLLGIVLGVIQTTERRRDRIESVIALVLLAVPPITIAGWLTRGSESGGSLGLAALLMVVVSAALVSRHQRAWTLRRAGDEALRTARSYGASRRFIAFRTLRTSSVAAVSLVGVDLPAQLGSAFFLEHAFHLRGLGEITWRAIAGRDVAWLMAVALGSAMLVALMQILGDIVLSELNPQIRAILLGKRGVFR